MRVEQRLVARVHRFPVDARHVGHPELVALQPPHFVQHLPPFARADRRKRARGRDRSSRSCATARRPTAARARAGRGMRSARIARSRLPCRSTSVDVIVRRARSGRPCRPACSALLRAKSKTSSRPGRSLWPPRPCAPATGISVHTTLSPATPAIWPNASFGHRKRRDAARDAVEIDAQRRRLVVGLVARAAWRIVGLHALGLRLERRARRRLQRDEVRPRGAREAQLELDVVVDRIERAQREEVEVLARRIERRAVVAELGRRDERARAVRDVVELDRASAAGSSRTCRRATRRRATTRDPRCGRSRCGRSTLHVSGVDVAEQHFVAVVGERDRAAARAPRASRRRARCPTAACASRRLRRRRARSSRASSLTATSVVAVGKPLPVPIADAVGTPCWRTAPSHSANVKSLPRASTARLWPAGWTWKPARLSAASTNLRAACVRCDGTSIDEPRRRVARGIEQPDLGAALIDDAPAVGLRVARVEIVVVGVPALVGCRPGGTSRDCRRLRHRTGNRCGRRSTSGS